MIVAAAALMVGLILGSFIEATAVRFNHKKSLRGRSYCPHCRHKLGWYDLLPVWSYLWLRGKCRYCSKKIPRQDLVVELLFGAVVVLFALTLPPLSSWPLAGFNLAGAIFWLDIIFRLAVISILGVVFLTDLATGLIPDAVTYPAALLALVYLLVSAGLRSWIFYNNLISNPLGRYLMPPRSGYFFDHLQRIWLGTAWTVGAAAAMAVLFALLIIFTRGRGMGWGDVKYVLFLGLALGFPDFLAAVFFAFLSGAAVSVGLILARKKRFGQTIPFGPFLSLGALFALLWGNRLIDWYLSYSF